MTRSEARLHSSSRGSKSEMSSFSVVSREEGVRSNSTERLSANCTRHTDDTVPPETLTMGRTPAMETIKTATRETTIPRLQPTHLPQHPTTLLQGPKHPTTLLQETVAPLGRVKATHKRTTQTQVSSPHPGQKLPISEESSWENDDAKRMTTEDFVLYC